MDAVVIFEFAAGAPGIRDALLERVGPLALSGEGRLSFVGRDPNKDAGPGSEIVAVGFGSVASAQAALQRWRGDPAFPEAVSARLLRIEPIWPIEPLALMFP